MSTPLLKNPREGGENSQPCGTITARPSWQLREPLDYRPQQWLLKQTKRLSHRTQGARLAQGTGRPAVASLVETRLSRLAQSLCRGSRPRSRGAEPDKVEEWFDVATHSELDLPDEGPGRNGDLLARRRHRSAWMLTLIGSTRRCRRIQHLRSSWSPTEHNIPPEVASRSIIRTKYIFCCRLYSPTIHFLRSCTCFVPYRLFIA